MMLRAAIATAAWTGLSFMGMAWSATFASAASDVVIQQVYTYGGVSGAAYKHDYVVLFNRGVTVVDLTGWTIQAKGPMTPEWIVYVTLSGNVAPGGYYLVRLMGSPLANGADLPAADAVSAFGLVTFAGSVVLVPPPSNQFFCQEAQLAADRVTYGTAGCAEGTEMPSLPEHSAALRDHGGCADSDDNLADFTAGPPAPRNSSSPPIACAVLGSSVVAARSSALLGPARPNPSAATTGFAFTVARDGPVRLGVFDLRGRRIRVLADGWRPAGEHGASWDGTGEDGAPAPAGVYFLRFEAPREHVRETLRFVRVR